MPEETTVAPWWKESHVLPRLSWLRSIPNVKYLGGWVGRSKPSRMATQRLQLGHKGLQYRSMRTIFTIPWGDMADIVIEGPDSFSKRVTVTRLATLGIFALAARKKNSVTSILTIKTKSGDEAAFQVDKITSIELKSKFAVIVSKLHKSVPQIASVPTPPLSVADELGKLADLRNDGVITQEDFDLAKAQLITPNT